MNLVLNGPAQLCLPVGDAEHAEISPCCMAVASIALFGPYDLLDYETLFRGEIDGARSRCNSGLVV